MTASLTTSGERLGSQSKPEEASPVNGSSPADGLGGRARSAVLWNTGFNLFRDVLQFVQMLVLARLLDESAYGQFAFVTSVICFLSVFSASPFLSHTLQVKSEDEAHYQDHFTAGAVIQFTMFVVTNLVGLLVARIPDYAGSASLIHVLSLKFLLDWTYELRYKMIERCFDFRNLRLLHGLGLLLGTITAIAMALIGCGAFSLVVPGMFVTLPFIWDLFVRQGWRPAWSFSWKNYHPAFQYGLTRIGSNLSIQGRSLLELSTLTVVLGFGQVGVLNRAVALAYIACTKTAAQLMYAIYPILTRLETQDGQAARAGDLVLRVVLWTAVPFAIGLGFLAEPLVDAIYGTRWSEVVPLLKWALGFALTASFMQVVYMLTLARSRPRLCFTSDCIVLLGTVLSLASVLRYGISYYLLSLTLVQLGAAIGLAWSLLQDRSLTTGGLAKATFPALFGSALGVSAASITCWIMNQHGHSLLATAIWGFSFALTYLVFLRVAFAASTAEIVRFIPLGNRLSRILQLPS